MLGIPGTFSTLKGIGIGLAVAAMCSGLAYCQGRSDGKAHIEAKIAKAVAAVKEQQVKANEAAATRRVDDLVITTKKEEEDAKLIAENPGGVLPPAHVALACSRLLRAGTSGADLPAACRSGGGDQSGAAPLSIDGNRSASER